MPPELDEDDDIEGASAEGLPPPNTNGASANGGPPRPKPRSPMPKKGESHTQEARGGVGVGRIAKTGVPALDAPYEEHDIEFLWPELLERLRASGRSEYQVQCRIVRISPGDKTNLGTIECSSVTGDESTNPADALTRRITDEFHMIYAQWPAKYDCQFVWKINGQLITRGTFGLPAPLQIKAQRDAEAQRIAASGGAAAPQSYGYGAAPQQPPRYAPQAPPPQPYYPTPGEDPEVAHLRAQLAQANAREEYFKGVTDEIRRANAEGRAPNIPPQQGFGAAPSQGLEERLAGAMERGFMKIADALTGGRATAGLGQQPQYAQPQYAPPPPPPEDPFAEMSRKLSQKLMEKTMERVASAIDRSMEAVDSATGLGAPDVDDAAPNTQLAPPPPVEEDYKTWKGSKSDFGTWSDGRPVIFPAKKDGGGIDPMGALFENPIIAETLMGGLNNLAEAATEALKKVASGESQHIRRVGPMTTAPVQAPPAGSLPNGGTHPQSGSSNGFDE